MSAQTPDQANMVNLTIDGRAIQVPKGTTVYAAALKLGIDIPIFCYMDRMPAFGACRMCLVEVEKMPKLQTSCTLEVAEGMVVKTQSTMAVQGREEILEFLLINHPLDCPICDRGGECPLQEHAYNHGPEQSRFFEDKRRFKKPWPLGPVLMLDRERCIICARCTRFGDLVAGDHALELTERGYKTEVSTPDGGPAESKFIGNTIKICPVGALTSQVYRFRARPWDNYPTNSSCTLCPVGCSLILDSRDGEIMRTRSRENPQVNDIWLCDKGWFGYEFVYNSNRLKTPLINRHGSFESISWEEALSLIANKFNEAKPSGKIAALGGDPLTLEDNYLFQKLIRDGANVNHIDHRIGTPLISLEEEGMEPGMEMSIGECEDLSFAFIFGVDLTEEFPVIWLRLRQAINRDATVFFFGNFAPEIAPYFKKVVIHPPGQELEILKQYLPELSDLAQSEKKGAIFVGRQYLYTPQRLSILSEFAHFQQTRKNLTLNIMEGHGNSMGARLAGMRPDLGPFGEQLKNPGFNAIQILENTAHNGWDFLYVAGANPALKFSANLWSQARSKLGFLVVQDLFLTETARQADVVLPTLSFVEKGGHFVNIEKRMQALLPGKEIPQDIYSDSEIFMKIAQKLNVSMQLDEKFLDILNKERLSMTRSIELEAKTDSTSTKEKAIHNQGLKAVFTPVLFDHGVRMMHNPHVIQLVKEPKARIHPIEGAKIGIQDGEKVYLIANDNTITAHIQFDKEVANDTIVLPLGFEEIRVHDLGVNLLNGLEIQIKREI